MRRRRGGGYPPPLKRLGQHFLVDSSVLKRIAAALELTGSETVVEIGPGRGELTDLLRPHAARLIAIEIDRALAAMLRERYAGDPVVEIVEADVLEMDPVALAGGPYVLAGNVPYYITTPILFQSLKSPQPLRSVFLVQREVAERIVAPPDSEGYGALSVNVQALARPELLFTVPAAAFRPAPAVESAVIRLTPREEPLVAPGQSRAFQKFVQALFGMRRKQLQRVLRSVYPDLGGSAGALLESHGWTPAARPETLSPAELARLFAVVSDIRRAERASPEN
ncbi:MAG TPA: 16S rRNA (adenine(1518)-N(6)/adenine(1519)-N(6))-dimethyltransferase RsmA [Gemmatimonadaceae bacterium]|nr:16S rRNA (adenine(1518)-N(6)/adenine(1519)-N(6))-dimethyltransferase RsmA [Gemmatimonadaceae bacterium]